MNRRILPLGAALLVSVALTGCRRLYEADLSPDGSTLAQATPKGLSLRPASGGAAHQLIGGDWMSPRFSPDGKFLVAAAGGKQPKTFVVEVATGKAKPLPVTLDPPFAWRPDGTELIGWQGHHSAAVFHLGSGKMVRSYPLDRPEDVRWLPSGRDLALSYENHVTLLHQGKPTSVPSELPIVAALGSSDDRLLWIETDMADNGSVPKGRMKIRSMDLATHEVNTVRDVAKVGDLLGGDLVHLSLIWPLALSVSPTGDKLAMACVISRSEPGLWERFMEVFEESRKNPNDVSLRRRREEMQNRLKFEAVTATIGLEDGSPIVLARAPDAKKENALPVAFRWSADGTRIALVYYDSARVIPLTQ